MIHKKFDFTVCYVKGIIYVFGGKDNSGEVTDNCEKYSVEANCWSQIASLNKKRYAASSCNFRDEKIFIFGGRFE